MKSMDKMSRKRLRPAAEETREEGQPAITQIVRELEEDEELSVYAGTARRVLGLRAVLLRGGVRKKRVDAVVANILNKQHAIELSHYVHEIADHAKSIQDSLKDSIGNLEHLEHLDGINDKLENLDNIKDSIGNLEYLDGINDKLEEMRDKLGVLGHLDQLEHLEDMKDSIGNLEYLDGMTDKLEEMRDKLGVLGHLDQLEHLEDMKDSLQLAAKRLGTLQNIDNTLEDSIRRANEETTEVIRTMDNTLDGIRGALL